VRGLKSSDFRRSIFKLKIQLFVFTKNLVKQLVLIAKGILKLEDSQRKTLGGWIITYIRVRDVSRRLAHKANAGEVVCLALGFLILLWAGGVVVGDIEVAEDSTCSGHHLLELLFLLFVSELVLFLALTFVTGDVLFVVVVLVGGVELLLPEAVDDEVGVLATLEAAPRWSPPLLMKPMQGVELSHQQSDLIIGDALILLIRSCGQRG
jgi:hypothetical protein